MLVTEKEAAEKWCPYGRHVPEFTKEVGLGTAYRSAFDTPSSGNKCIGSRCMAWRKVIGEFDAYGNFPGYCGAFGKVEP